VTRHPDRSSEPLVALASAAEAPGDAPPAPAPSTLVREVTPVGEAVRPFLNPLRIVVHLWRHRHLVRHLTVRELAARYRGSFLGIMWSMLLPLFTLAIYTFVFSLVFKARWGVADQGRGLVALILFAGIIPFNVFSEVVSVAPSTILGNPGYVKRVVFPLEVLPLVKFLGALVQGLVSAVVLVLAIAIMRGTLSPTLAFMPIAWVPLLLLALGTSYGLSALGVFVRDVGQAVVVILPFLFFLTPIVYPIEAVPAQLRFIPWMNPLAHVVEDARRTAIFGLAPNWRAFANNCVLCGTFAYVGFLFFMKSKRAFHDAL
jgi:lipopolysaccharide transport system permease protein